VDLVSQAISLTGTIVMGLPIMVTLTESERNNQGMSSMPAIPGAPMSGYVLFGSH
jgi:RNA-binding protein 39